MDKNLYFNQKHLENILNGTQNQYLERINDPMNVNSYPIEVLKRKEWVRQNQHRMNPEHHKKNGVDMIGTGNLYDPSKVETIIARDKYFQNKYSANQNPGPQSKASNPPPNNQYKDMERQSRHSQSKASDKGSRHSQMSNPGRHSQMSNHSRHSQMSNPNRRSNTSDAFRNSRDQGWGPDVVSRNRAFENPRGSMHAKEHNDALFKKKSAARKSLGYTNISQGSRMRLLLIFQSVKAESEEAVYTIGTTPSPTKSILIKTIILTQSDKVLSSVNTNMTMNQHIKKTIFDFTKDIKGNMRTINPNKYQKDVLETLSKSGLQRLGHSMNMPRRVGNENAPAQAQRDQRNKMLKTRYNIITNQFQNY